MFFQSFTAETQRTLRFRRVKPKNSAPPQRSLRLCGEGKDAHSRWFNFSLGLVLIALGSGWVWAQDAQFEAQRRKVAPGVFYPVLEGLVSYRKNPPSQEQIASYANTILAQKGFDFTFYVYPTPTAEKPSETVVIPCYRVTAKSIESTDLGGQPLTLKRPASYRLFEVCLVDESLTNVLRRWELPFEAAPTGLSEDGKKLYLPTKREGLMLEVSENQIAFKAKDKHKTIRVIPIEPSPSAGTKFQFLQSQGFNNHFILRFQSREPNIKTD